MLAGSRDKVRFLLPFWPSCHHCMLVDNSPAIYMQRHIICLERLRQVLQQAFLQLVLTSPRIKHIASKRISATVILHSTAGFFDMTGGASRHQCESDRAALTPQVSPLTGNVAFSSAQSGWSFTLQSFSQLYCDVLGVKFDTAEFARRLWGDVYFHPGTYH